MDNYGENNGFQLGDEEIIGGFGGFDGADEDDSGLEALLGGGEAEANDGVAASEDGSEEMMSLLGVGSGEEYQDGSEYGVEEMGQQLPDAGEDPVEDYADTGEFFDDGADEFGTHVEGIGGEEEYGLAQVGADIVSPSGEFVVQSTEGGEEDHFEIVYVPIQNIGCTATRVREEHDIGALLSSIRSTGLLQPPVVVPAAAEGYYVLVKGLRRLVACAKAGITVVPCLVNNRINTTEIPIIEALYNHHTPYSVAEIIKYIDYLEKSRGIHSPSMIEFLLQMDPGDYTKLKDILSDGDEDIVSKLKNGQLTIQAAFKALEKRRKTESREEKEMQKAAGVYGDTSESGAAMLEGSGEQGTGEGMTDDEMKELAISSGELGDADDEDLAALCDEGGQIEGFQPHKQDPHYRERLDPNLRKSVLARDENTCRICGMGGQEYVDVMDVHHITEVYLGGDDSIDNLITACTVCHKLVHLYGRGELHIRPESELSPEEAKKFKRVAKLGNVIRKQMAMRGMKKDDLKKFDNAQTIGRTKPGTGQVAG